MRVLYVALTRPKEKLIITGAIKRCKKKLEEKRVLLDVSKGQNVNISLFKKYTSYLDWLELAYLNDIEKMKEAIDFNILNIENIVDKYSAFNKEVQDNSNNIKVFFKNYEFDKDDYKIIEDLLSFTYKKQELTTIQSKMSVTALKRNFRAE